MTHDAATTRLDWLGTGVTSNNNQSNSYVLRQRQFWAEAKLHNRLGLFRRSGVVPGDGNHEGPLQPGWRHHDSARPSTRNYDAGFVWTRQYSFRVTKDSARRSSLVSRLRMPVL